MAKYIELSAAEFPSDLKVLELGAGCSALPSLVLSKLRTTDLTLTDKKSALELLSLTVSENDVSAKVEELDWTDPREYHVDIIFLADALAFPELYPSLLATLRLIYGTLYIAYERRDFTQEIEFFRELGKTWTFEMIPESSLDEVYRAEGIYLYRAQRR